MKKTEQHDDGLAFDFMADSEEIPYVRPRGVEPLEIKKSPAELLLVYSPKKGAKFVDEKFGTRKNVGWLPVASCLSTRMLMI